MTDPYLPWVTGYVLVALALYVATNVAMIIEGRPIAQCRKAWVDLVASVLFFLVLPPAIAWLLLKGLAEQVWDATKAWCRLFRKDSGTEELLMGVWWAYMGWIFFSVGGWWVTVLCGFTTLYLWQSARALQRLREETALERGREIHENPPPAVMARFHEHQANLAAYNAQVGRLKREESHRRHLDWVRKTAAVYRDDIAIRVDTWRANRAVEEAVREDRARPHPFHVTTHGD